MSWRTSDVRLGLFRLAVLMAFAIVIAQLWRMQILAGNQYRRQAEGNRIRIETVDAPRGVIYDRGGRILVRNEPSFSVSLVPAGVTGVPTDTLLVELAALLDLPLSDEQALARADANGQGDEPRPLDINVCTYDLQNRRQHYGLRDCFNYVNTFAPYRTILLRRSVSAEVAYMIRERAYNMPGVVIDVAPRRQYLYGPLLSHVLGYVAPITPEYLASASKRFAYEENDIIGVAGLEAGIETLMRGRKGRQVAEKNVIGQQVRTIYEEKPIPGSNVFLTVDLDLQRVTTEALRKGMEAVGSPQGVAIMMNPQTGEILSLVSLPSYDNNLFIGGISEQNFRQLLDDPNHPLLNLAMGGFGFPPGSIFKLVTAAGALEDGVVTLDTKFPDPGIIHLPNKFFPDDMSKATPFYCWKRDGHGDQNVIEALAHSCDVYFYKAAGGFKEEAEGLGVDRLVKWATAFGLGEPTGIDFPGESAGLVPSPKWKRLAPHINESWVTGDTYNMSIGQGYLVVTPLQMLNVTAAVANGGTLFRPQLVYQVQDTEGQVERPFKPEVLRHVRVSPPHLQAVREGMLAAVEWEDGTARYAGLPTSVRVAGKTGTAEYCQPNAEKTDCLRDKDGYQLTHAWFTAFAPYDNPEVAIIVFVHGNGKDIIEGSEVAAPIAAEILHYYFEQWPKERLSAPTRLPPPAPVVTPTLTLPTPAASEPTVATESTAPPAAPTEQSAQPPAAPTQPLLQPTAAATSMPVAPPPTQAPPPPTPVLPTATVAESGERFEGFLLRVEPREGDFSMVSGRVVDAGNNPLAGVTITIDGGGAPVATLTTGGDGSFRYDLLNPNTSPRWYVRAPALPGTPFIALDVKGQEHVIVMIQASR